MVCMCLAQQEAQRAQFYVEKAKQDQRQKIIQAEGEAEAARMVTVWLSGQTVWFLLLPQALYPAALSIYVLMRIVWLTLRTKYSI